MTVYTRVIITVLSVFNLATADLYNSSDPVALLTVDNFNQNLIGSETAWIIEFYASWCGHCIRFAPTWRAFATEVKDWHHTVQVGVVDCSDEENAPVCRQYEINVYPTVRLYGPFTKQGDVGVHTGSRTVDSLQKTVVDFIISLQTEGNSSKTWVNLLNYENNIEDVFEDAPPTSSVAIVIEEKENSIVGSQTILDLGRYSMLYVRRMVSPKPYTNTLLPLLYFVWRNEQITFVDSGVATRNDQTDTIKNITMLYNGLVDTTTRSYAVTSTYPKERLPISLGNSRSYQVYLVDIENAVSYALGHEVILHKTISGESLEALKKFVHVLVKYLPSRPPVHRFLKKFHEYISKQNYVGGKALSRVVSQFSSGASLLPEAQPWVGCKGSDPKYRGYPCGLWTTFHTLTVNAVLADGKKLSYDPQEVLEAIHGYVKHFFSCEHCSQHFQAMYAVDAKEYVTSANDGIMWLWKGHNQVNTRLKGDPTEDPKHIKIPFPCANNCPECWDENKQFNQLQVLIYLKKIYSRDSISLLGAQPLEIFGSLENREMIVKGGISTDSTLDELPYQSFFDWIISLFSTP